MAIEKAVTAGAAAMRRMEILSLIRPALAMGARWNSYPGAERMVSMASSNRIPAGTRDMTVKMTDPVSLAVYELLVVVRLLPMAAARKPEAAKMQAALKIRSVFRRSLGSQSIRAML